MKTSTILTPVIVTLTLVTSAYSENAGIKGKGPDGKRLGGPARELLLEKFDNDGDGKLSEAERSELKKEMLQRKEARQAKMLERFDTDKDGTLTREEKKAAFPVIAKENREIHQAVLGEFDKDGDGKLVAEEVRGVREWIQINHPDAIMMRPRAMRACKCGKLGRKGPRALPLAPGKKSAESEAQ